MKMQPQNINQQMNTEYNKPALPKKSMSLLQKISIIIVIIMGLGFIIFLIILARTEDTPTNEPIIDNNETSDAVKLLILILVLGGLLMFGYVLFIKLNKEKSNEMVKIPVPPDKAEELFKENFSLRYGIECIYDNVKKMYIPSNKDSILLINKQPFFHTATGDSFLLLEIEVTEGKMKGIHMVILPIDKGEQTIKDGWYRIETNTPKFTFQLNKINFPMSSTADKNDRMRLAMLDKMEEKENNSDYLKLMEQQQQTQQNYLSDDYNQNIPSYRPPIRRSKYYRRR